MQKRENAWGELGELRRYMQSGDELVDVAFAKGVTPLVVEEAYERSKITTLARHVGLAPGDIRRLAIHWGIVGEPKGA